MALYYDGKRFCLSKEKQLSVPGVVQPPLTPGNPRTSQRCILACAARIAGWCAVDRDGLALSLSLYKSSELGGSGTP